MNKKILLVLVIIIVSLNLVNGTKLLADESKKTEIVSSKIWFNDQVKLKNNSEDTLTVKVIVNSKSRRNKKGFYKLIKLNPNSTKVVTGFTFKGTGGSILGSKKISDLEIIICE